MLWTEGDVFAEWCANNLIQSEDQFAGQPLVLEEWQQDFFDAALTVIDEETLEPYWRTVALVVSRKNGKTAMLAALALYRLFNDVGRPEILLAAGTDKQAGKLFDACINYLRKNPELDDLVQRREYIGEIVHIATGGKIIRLSSTGDTLDGANPSLAICDELHAWTTPTRRRVWDSLNTAGGARKRSQVFTITTAGDAASRHSSILGRIIDGTEGRGESEKKHLGLTVSKNHEGRTLLFNYSAPTLDPLEIEAMQLANPASWITDDYLRAQSNVDGLESSTILQLHGCVWAATETTFIAPAVIGGAFREDRIEDGDRVVLGFDGSEKRDETWLVACRMDGFVEPLNRWFRPPGATDEWRIPRKQVHAAVDAAMRRFDVVEMSCDPPGWYSEIDEWTDKYGETVVMFETRQPSKMAPACERTEAAMNDGTFRFGGPLAQVLAGHFGNCIAVPSPYGTLATKDFKDSPRKIDGAIASIIAFDRAAWHDANTVAYTGPMVAFG